MGFFPCVHCGRPQRGPNRNFYVAIGAASDFHRYRLRLCSRHGDVTQDNLAQFKIDPNDGAAGWDGALSKCVACFQPVDEDGWQVFVTGYPTKDEREDYWGKLHVNCNIPDYLGEQLALPVAVSAQNVSIPAPAAIRPNGSKTRPGGPRGA